jgi:hypothetical protein
MRRPRIIAPACQSPSPCRLTATCSSASGPASALGDDPDSQSDRHRSSIFYARNPEYLERVFSPFRAVHAPHRLEVERAACRWSSRCCRWSRAPSSPTPIRAPAPTGLWQFIPGTGTRFGLKQNWWYDGRRDVLESTRAALDYLQFLHDEFDGDWLLAIAAYNCGEGCVARAVRDNRAAAAPTISGACAAEGDPRLRAEAAGDEAARAHARDLRHRLQARSRTSPTSCASRRQPDRPEARRRARRHHHRGTVRAEPGLPPLGHAAAGARTTCWCRPMPPTCSARTSRS